MSSPDDSSLLVKAIEWGWTVVAAVVAYLWNSFRGEINSMKAQIAILEEAVPNARERAKETADNQNMRDNVVKIFDRLDSLQQQSHEQYVALTTLINTKADK